MAPAHMVTRVIAKRPFDLEPQALKDRNAARLFLQNLNDHLCHPQVAGCIENRLRHGSAKAAAAIIRSHNQVNITTWLDHPGNRRTAL